MAQFAIGQLIKIIIGIFVLVAIVVALYLFFSGTVLDFFKNLPGANASEMFLSLIK